MNVFITGGTGFIGKHAVNLLKQKKHEILLLTRDKSKIAETFAFGSNVHLLEGQLCEIHKYRPTVKSFQPDALIHLAWEGLPDYSSEMCRRNLDYGKEIFTFAVEVGCKMILSTGSCWEYKSCERRVSEDNELEWDSPFASAKNSLCLFGKEICRENGLNFYWPRLFFVYGPGQRKTSLIPSIINSLQKGKVPEIKFPGNRNDFIYVKDAAEAIVELIEKQPEGSIYNVGTGCPATVSEILSIIQKFIPAELPEQDNSCRCNSNFWADNSLMKDQLGYIPKFRISDGINETLEHLTKYNDLAGKI